MARVISLFVDTSAQIGENPRRVKCITLDDLATVTAAAWINPALLVYGVSLLPTDIIDMIYSYNAQTNSGTYGEFLVAISNGTVTLSQTSSGGNVLLPVTAGNLAVFNGTSGQITSNPLASPATAINYGNIQAGASGVAGNLISFPATAANGSLIISALNAGGAFNTTVRNSVMGQSSVVSIPDPGAATANFLLNSGVQSMAAGSRLTLAKVNGTEAANAVTTVNGNAGVITTSSLTTAAGASYAITWTNTAIVAGSSIQLTLMGGSNTVKSVQLEATAGAGTSTLTIYNIGPTASLDGTILIGYAVL